MKKLFLRIIVFFVAFIAMFYSMINANEHTLSNDELGLKWGILSYLYSPTVIVVLLLIIIVLLLKQNKRK